MGRLGWGVGNDQNVWEYLILVPLFCPKKVTICLLLAIK